MAFFQGSSNFKISGGTFNVISGDLNQYENNYTTFTSQSYNNNPGEIPSQPYHPYRPRPPHGNHPPRRPQPQHQEHGPFGHAEYSQGNYGGYEGRTRLESSLRSPAHVDITGGDFYATRRDHPGAWGRQDFQMYDSRDSTPSSSGVVDPASYGNSNVQENLGEPDLSGTGVVEMSEEETAPLPDTSDPAVPAAQLPADAPPALSETPPPPTFLERMRTSMADLDITDTDQAQPTVDALNPTTSQAQGKQKSTQSLAGKIFRTGRKQ